MSASALWSADVRLFRGVRQYQGRDQVEERVRQSWMKWVRDHGFVFRALENAQQPGGSVELRWELVPFGGGAAVSCGRQVLALNASGLIVTDQQFVDP